MLIRDLRWLLVLAEEEHVTTAAAVLGTTQPTVSRVLARLEAELGAAVFERASGGIHLSPVGPLVLDAARDVVDRYDRLRDDLAQVLDPDGGVVRLAFLDSIASSLVPRVLRGFHQQAPRVRVALSQEPAHDILRDLVSGSVDLAITSARPDGDIAWHPLQEERLVLVVPSHHPLVRRDGLDLAELGDADVVTTPVGFGYRSLVEELFGAAGVPLRVSFESQDLATIEGLVAAGLGVAVLPEGLAGASGTVGIPLTTPGAHRTIGLAWRSDRSLTPPAARLRDHVVGAEL